MARPAVSPIITPSPFQLSAGTLRKAIKGTYCLREKTGEGAILIYNKF